MTFLCWVYNENGTAAGAERTIVHNTWDTFEASVLFRVEPADNSLEGFYIQDNNVQVGGGFTDSTVTDDQWDLVSFVVDDGVLRAYLNGSASSTTYGSGGNKMDSTGNSGSITYGYRGFDVFEGHLELGVFFDSAIGATYQGAMARGVNPFAFDNFTCLRLHPMLGTTSATTEPDWGQAGGTSTANDTLGKGVSNPPVELLENYL